MNNKLLALSLVASPGLMAQDTNNLISDNGNGRAYEQTGYCNTCCSNRCTCKPACVPKPKKCIDCECYTPAYYDLQCDTGFFADVAFLYWYARETNLSYALKVQGAENPLATTGSTQILVFAPQTYKHLDTKWVPGVRVGIGFNSECDGWDYYLNWTYFRNTKKGKTSVPNTYAVVGSETADNIPGNEQFALINPWNNASFNDGTVVSFDTISAKWRLVFNQIDLELGRKYWVSKYLTMRPYTALRGAWTNTKFNTLSSRTSTNASTSTDTFTSFKDSFKTKNWGVGFVGGIQPNWFFCSNFVLFGNVDVALIWGEFDVKKNETYSATSTTASATTTSSYTSSPSSNKFSQMNAILDLAIGLRWEETWCDDQYRTYLDLGWEHHIWFDHNHRNKSFAAFVQSVDTGPTVYGFTDYAEASGNLGYGGFVLRLGFAF